MKNIIKKIRELWLDDETGSAIVLALIIIAGLTGTGVGAARLAKSNVQQVAIFEDSLRAYYAAEAGIEAALLEWRFNHDVELWDQEKATRCSNNPVDTNQDCEWAKVATYVALGTDSGSLGGTDMPHDISSRWNEYGELISGSEAPRNEPWYEMKIYYRDPMNPYLGNYLGNPWQTNEYYPELTDLPRIAKDESYEIKFPESDEVKILQVTWSGDIEYGNNANLSIHPVGIDENGNTKIINNMNVSPENTYFTKSVTSNVVTKSFNIVPIVNDYNALKSVRIKCLSNQSTASSVNSPYDSGGVFISAEAKDGSGAVIHMPQDVVTIEVIGHYNDIDRKVEYRINRESGNILDIFDTGVFSKTTFRK